MRIYKYILLVIVFFSDYVAGAGLGWPIDCEPGKNCNEFIGYPDIDGDGTAFNCQSAGYVGHEGTDISISWEKMDQGVDVLAAYDGTVLWVFDGKFDRCPDAHADCQPPPNGWFEPGQSNGYRVCTEIGNYCGTGQYGCFWCFDGGNVVVIRHNTGIVFATRYDHLKNGSIIVSVGQSVIKGQKIAEVGSAGHSTGPHLHFEVWGAGGFYNTVDPWKGICGSNTNLDYWENEPAWSACPIDSVEICGGLDEVINYGILNNENISCRARNSITMAPGFYVEYNAKFHSCIVK